MSIMMNIADLLLRPAAFFSGRLKGDKPDLKMPLVIVLLYGIVSALSAANVSSVTMAMMPAEIAGMEAMMTAIAVISAFIGALILWVVIAAIFHGISVLLGGKGDFQRTLAVAGYGSLPMIFGSVLSAIIIYTTLSDMTIRPVSDPMQISAAVNELMSISSMTVAKVISFIYVVWCANLWVFGVKVARSLSYKDALITVGIPVVLYFLITFVPLIW